MNLLYKLTKKKYSVEEAIKKLESEKYLNSHSFIRKITEAASTISPNDYYLKAYTKEQSEIGKEVTYNQLNIKDSKNQYNEFCTHLFKIRKINDFSLIEYLKTHNAYNESDIKLIIVHLHNFNKEKHYNEIRVCLKDILEYLKLENESSNTNNESQQNSKKDTKKKLAFNEKDKLSNLIIHENRVEIVKNIKFQYNGIKGKELRILLKALQELDLLPNKRIAAKFHRCCLNEFEWDIGSTQAMEEKTFIKGYLREGKYVESIDDKDLNKKVKFLKTLIKTN